MFRILVANIFVVSGILLVTVAAWLISPALAYAVLGTIAFIIGIGMIRE